MNDSREARLEQAANALRQARRERVAIARISEAYDISGIADAYAVAQININAQLFAGRRIVGHKVGLTAKAVQQQLGVGQPDFGVLLDDMEYVNGDEIPAARLLQPKVEAEIAFVLGSELPTSRPSWSEFLRAVAYALPAIEIVDSVIKDWKITLVDTVADNASSGLYVLGDQPVAIGSVALQTAGMQMAVNGEIVSVGSGAACLGHPLRAAYWLACTMAAQGVAMKAGEVILSGALGPMVPVKAGDRVDAVVGGVGSCSARFI
jgi:2-keto-4-pentenoate hydratase